MAGWETTHHNKYLIVLNIFFIFSIIQKRNKITYSITYNIKIAKLKKKNLKQYFQCYDYPQQYFFYILFQYYFPWEADVTNSYDIIPNVTLLRG